jgi:hypothetical protein
LWWPRALPVVCKARWIGGPGVLLPLQFGMHWGAGRHRPSAELGTPWNDRKEALVWRGVPTGFQRTSSQQRMRFVRELRLRGNSRADTVPGLSIAAVPSSHRGVCTLHCVWCRWAQCGLRGRAGGAGPGLTQSMAHTIH